jgi:hypothetical protein
MFIREDEGQMRMPACRALRRHILMVLRDEAAGTMRHSLAE